MSQRLRVIGNYLSPYVRKVLVCLELKGLEYEVDPIAPFVGNDEFTRLSPLRRIPVLLDGELVLSDSSVICQYLEDRHPTPALYPRDIADRARARWLEEYADTRLADGLIWRLFHQLAIKRHVFGEAPNEAVVQHAREVEIPAALDYRKPRDADADVRIQATLDESGRSKLGFDLSGFLVGPVPVKLSGRIPAQATVTLPRERYWNELFGAGERRAVG